MLGVKIKDYLDANGIKQTFVSEKANIPHPAFVAMLSGKRRIEVMEYYRICKALNVDILTFIDDSESEV